MSSLAMELELTEDKKKELLEEAMAQCSQILLLTGGIIGAKNFMESTLTFSNGETWKLRFEKIKE